MVRKSSGETRSGRVKTLEQRLEDFAEEVQRLGENFGKWIEEESKKHQSKEHQWRKQHDYPKHYEYEHRFHKPFGLVGPFISAILGVILLALVVWAIGVVNFRIDSLLLAGIHFFLNANMGIFFLLFLFSSYNTYFSKVYPKLYFSFSPVANAVGITVAFWIVASVINISNLYIGSYTLYTITFYVLKNLHTIFVLVLLVGYMVILMKFFPSTRPRKSKK